MSTDTSSATVEDPTATVASPKPLPAKVFRIAAMTQQLLDETRAQPPDAAGLDRLRAIDMQAIRELQNYLSPDLHHELHRLTEPLTSHTELSDAELRIARAQLVGWLEGLVRTLQTAVSGPRVTPATDPPVTPSAPWASASRDSTSTSPNDHDHRPGEPHNTEANLAYTSTANPNNAAILAARRTLIAAITQRITQKRLTAAQAASALHLTGPRVTELLHGNIDKFTLAELVNLLPALELTIQIVPANS